MELEVMGGFGRSDECIQIITHKILKELIKMWFLKSHNF